MNHLANLMNDPETNKFPLALLNCSIVTSDGSYNQISISLDQATELIRDAKTYNNFNTGILSAIGHDSTAQILTDLLNTPISANRITFRQQTGQSAIVIVLKKRCPEGVILSREEIEEIGYEFKLLTKTA